MAAETNDFKYWAYISSSHKDADAAAWLHGALEAFAIPTALVGRPTRNGLIPRRLSPIYRDTKEIPTSSDLGAVVRETLEQSRFLIVVCSPNSAASRWVNEEIRFFKHKCGESRVLCLIIDGEPNASDQPGGEANGCFPVSLRHAINPQGQLVRKRIEPIAADIRPGHDTKSIARLRLVAGILGVDFDLLRRRDQVRRRKRRIFAAATAVLLASMLCAAGVAVLVSKQGAAAQRLAKEAEERRANEQARRANEESGRADQQAKLANAQAKIKQFQVYLNDMHEVQVAWAKQGFAQAAALLARYDVASPGGLGDLRGFEWYYWHRRLTQSDSGVQVPFVSRCMAISPNGRFLAATDDIRLAVWDRAAKRLLRTVTIGTGKAPMFLHGYRPQEMQWQQNVAFSADSKLAAATCLTMTAQQEGRGSLRVWDVESGDERLRVIDDRGISGRAVLFSPDGKFVLTGGREPAGVASNNVAFSAELGTLFKCWDLQTKQERVSSEGQLATNRIKPLTLSINPIAVENLGFSPDGQLFFAYGAAPRDRLHRWPDLLFGKDQGVHLQGASRVVNRKVTGETGHLSLSGPHHPILVRKGDSGLEWASLTIPELDKPTNRLPAIEFADLPTKSKVRCLDLEGELLATGNDDLVVRLWSFAKRPIGPPQEFEGHTADITCVALGPKMLASADDNRTIRIWNPDAVVERIQLSGKSPNAKGDWISASGKLAATPRDKASLQIESVSERQKLIDVPTSGADRIHVAFSPHEQFVAVTLLSEHIDKPAKNPPSTETKSSASVRLFNLVTRKEVPWDLALPGESSGPLASAASFSPDDSKIATTWGDVLTVSECATGRMIMSDKSKSTRVVAFSPTGRFLAAGGMQGFSVRQVSDWKPFISETAQVDLFAFDGQDERLVVGQSGLHEVWNLKTGEKIPQASFTDSRPGGTLAFSRDSSRLFELDTDSITILSAETSSPILELPCGNSGANAAQVETLLDELLATWKAEGGGH